jgi:uncharacterized phage-associated protein
MLTKNHTVDILDVAAYILRKKGRMTTWKLQKLVYYCQAWSLVWDERPLFRESIEAWANGPVVRELYNEHKGLFEISKSNIKRKNPKRLNQMQKDTVNAVLEFYGDKPSQWLSDLTHAEDPWKKARIGLSLEARSNRIISHESMSEYYGGLLT